MSYIVASRVKEHISCTDMMMSSELAAALSASVAKQLDAAIVRARLNGRKTVRPEDL